MPHGAEVSINVRFWNVSCHALSSRRAMHVVSRTVLWFRDADRWMPYGRLYQSAISPRPIRHAADRDPHHISAPVTA
jgi:hypothetical protein